MGFRQHDIRLCLSKFEVVHPTHPTFAIAQKLLQTVSLKEPEKLIFVPYSDEWNISFIRHKRTTKYIHDRKHIVEIKRITEKRQEMRDTVKGKEIPVRLENDHTEVEVIQTVIQALTCSNFVWNTCS